MTKKFIQSFKNCIEQSERIMVAAHVRPDGDSIGSILAMGLALREAGKYVEMVSEDGVPRDFRKLQGADQISHSRKENVDLVIVLDSGDLTRLGSTLEGIDKVDVNIDHHKDNPQYGALNLVDPEAASTTEILAEILPAVGLPITQAVANALLFGILTDSQRFRTLNTTPNTLRTAATLMEHGADINQLNQILAQRSFKAVRYWGVGLSTLEQDDGLAWARLSLAGRKAVGYPGRDDADLVSVISNIDGVRVAVLFIEQENDAVKISWRAKKGYDVSKIANHFGGGGHTAAAGATIEGKLKEVQSRVLEATKTMLN